MNYLAHAFLSNSRPETILGNLMADFIKGRPGGGLSPGILNGIRIHREIDAFTDAHPAFRRSYDRIRTRWRLYSGILVDMFYDHFLATEWNRYSARPLREFADFVYSVLRDHADSLPGRFQTPAERMIRYDWLVSYGDLRKLKTSLARISTRSRNPHLHLELAMGDLADHYDALASDFHEFFPQLIDSVNSIQSPFPSPD